MCCRTSQGNGDDDPPYSYEDYVGSLSRLRMHLAPSLKIGALSEIVALLDGFKGELADPEGDSPCTMFCRIAAALIEKGDNEGAEIAMREGIETRGEGDNIFCHDSRLAELIIDHPGPGGTTRRWRAIARAMRGGLSADDCLRRAAFYWQHRRRMRRRRGGTSLMGQRERPNLNQISTTRANA